MGGEGVVRTYVLGCHERKFLVDVFLDYGGVNYHAGEDVVHSMIVSKITCEGYSTEQQRTE